MQLNLEQLVVAPNPVLDELTIHYYHPSTFDLTYEIVSIEGRVMTPKQTYGSRQGANEMSINCDTLNPGRYFIRLHDTDGRQQICHFTKQ